MTKILLLQVSLYIIYFNPSIPQIGKKGELKVNYLYNLSTQRGHFWASNEELLIVTPV